MKDKYPTYQFVVEDIDTRKTQIVYAYCFEINGESIVFIDENGRLSEAFPAKKYIVKRIG